MDPLAVPRVSSRSLVLRFFRNLFGLRQSTQEQGDAWDLEENSSLVPAVADVECSQPAGTELRGHHLDTVPRGEAPGDRLELLGELMDLSLGGTPSSHGRRSPPTLDTRGMEMGGSGDWALSDLSESGSCIDASVDEEKQVVGSRTGEPCGQCSGTGDAGGSLAKGCPMGRPSVLQLVRNLFGLRQSTQEGPEIRADAQERGDTTDLEENSFLVPDVADSENHLTAGKELTGDHPTSKPCGVATGDQVEELLGELKDISLGDISSSRSRSPTLDPSGMEMGDSGGFVNVAVSKDNKTAQDPYCGISDREAERVGEASSDTGTWGKSGISQVLHPDDGGITPTAGPLAITPEELHAKEEREHLLTEDLNGGSPKAGLSPWNKLINMYKQRRKLPVPKHHLQENPAQLGMEEGPTLNLTVYEFATSEPHLISSKSSTTALIYRLPDAGARETAGHFGRTQLDLRANGLGAPEED